HLMRSFGRYCLAKPLELNSCRTQSLWPAARARTLSSRYVDPLGYKTNKTKTKNMMTLSTSSKTQVKVGAALFAISLIAFIAGISGARGADTPTARGGASKLVEMTQIKTPAEAEALKPGDSIAMVCAKCKTVIVERIEQQRGQRFMVPGAKHLCTGCGA